VDTQRPQGLAFWSRREVSSRTPPATSELPSKAEYLVVFGLTVRLLPRGILQQHKSSSEHLYGSTTLLESLFPNLGLGVLHVAFGCHLQERRNQQKETQRGTTRRAGVLDRIESEP
jgi:hypothetical protein